MRRASLLDDARRAAAIGVFAAFAAALGHCEGGVSCTILASDYDTACTADSDCVAVFSGSFCGANECACENAAINTSAQASYESAFQRDNAPRCPCPAPPPVACLAGACAVVPYIPDAGAD